jgi:L-gulono-1,4-lactone dehydrogenase
MSEPSDPHETGAQWHNWAGDERCVPAALRSPRSVDELSAAIADASLRDLRVRVAGAGHSFSDIVLTDGLMLTLKGLSKVLDVDRPSGLVRVQAGITIRELSRELAGHGLALENLGDVDAQSIAGAISTATHGTGARLQNVSSQVSELTLVLADGSTLVCSAERDPEVFRAARVGLGSLGAIAEVTLRCVPAFTLHGVDAPAPLEETLERFEELALANDHFEFFVFPHARHALTRTNNRTEQPPRPRGRLSAYANDVVLTNHAFELSCRAERRLPGRIPQLNRLVTRLAGRSERVERSHEIFASPRLVRFTEMEYALPRERTVEAVRRVMELIDQRGFAVPFPIEARTVAADDAFLSTAAGRDSGYVAVHMYRGMAWEPYFRAVEAIMDELGGRPHWGKRHFQTAETLRERYPDWDRFQCSARPPRPRGAVRERVGRAGTRTHPLPSYRPRTHQPEWPSDRPCRGRRCRTHPSTRSMAEDPYQRLEHATAGLEAPFAIVDLDALWENAADLERRAGPKPIRLASKSVRCRPLQERILARGGFRGTLAFTLPEALWLASHRTDDLVVAYPTADAHALRALAERAAGRPGSEGPDGVRVTVMVDSVEQIELLERVVPRGAGAQLRVCIDIDAGWRAFGGRLRVGAKRSPLHTPGQAAGLARAILGREDLRLVGMMAYEAQIAGVGDTPPGRPVRAGAIRLLQARSARELAGRRAAIVAAVEDAIADRGGAPLEFVNGGGTGSLERTAAEPAVTEVAAGSGLYGPTLFDAYRSFTPRPAALFALPVVRRPGPGAVTVLGGGYLASGPADAARLPRPHLSGGLGLDRQEGAGEVQTPLLGAAADALAIGDRVYFRHAKAGELCERFASLHLLEGDRIVEELPTYRGKGQCFL